MDFAGKQVFLLPDLRSSSRIKTGFKLKCRIWNMYANEGGSNPLLQPEGRINHYTLAL